MKFVCFSRLLNILSLFVPLYILIHMSNDIKSTQKEIIKGKFVKFLCSSDVQFQSERSVYFLSCVFKPFIDIPQYVY